MPKHFRRENAGFLVLLLLLTASLWMTAFFGCGGEDFLQEPFAAGQPIDGAAFFADITTDDRAGPIDCCKSFGWGIYIDLFLPSSQNPPTVVVAQIYLGEADTVGNFAVTMCHDRHLKYDKAFLAPELVDTHELRLWSEPGECNVGWFGDGPRAPLDNMGTILFVQFDVEAYGWCRVGLGGDMDSIYIPYPVDDLERRESTMPASRGDPDGSTLRDPERTEAIPRWLGPLNRSASDLFATEAAADAVLGERYRWRDSLRQQRARKHRAEGT